MTPTSSTILGIVATIKKAWRARGLYGLGFLKKPTRLPMGWAGLAQARGRLDI
jgi:hypothetical protein